MPELRRRLRRPKQQPGRILARPEPTAQPGARAEVRWYVAKDQQPLGPFALAQLRRLVASSQLHPSDLVLREGTQQWVAATSVSGLFPEPATPAAPPAAVDRSAQGGDESVEALLAGDLDHAYAGIVRQAEEIAQNLAMSGVSDGLRGSAMIQLQHLGELIRANPDRWQLWYARGLTLASGLGDKEGALKSLQKAASLAPQEVRIQQAIDAFHGRSPWHKANQAALKLTLILLGVCGVGLLICAGMTCVGTRDSSRERVPAISPAVGQQQAKVRELKDRIRAFQERSGRAERSLRDAVRLKEDGHDAGSVAYWIAEIDKMPAELAELQGEFKRVKENVEQLSKEGEAARGSKERPAGDYDALSSMRVDLAGMSAELDASGDNVRRAAEEATRARKP